MEPKRLRMYWGKFVSNYDSKQSNSSIFLNTGAAGENNERVIFLSSEIHSFGCSKADGLELTAQEAPSI